MKPVVQVVNNLEFGWAATISGLLGAAFSKLYGGANLYWISALVLVLVMDWVGGTTAAKKDRSYASAYGIQGIKRTGVILLLPVLGNVLDKALGLPGFIFFAFTGGLVYHTLNSMIANFSRAGWDRWIPVKVLEWVASEIEAKAQRSEERKPTVKGEDA